MNNIYHLGGGVATDQPAVGGNEVKYLQSQMSLDEMENGILQKSPNLADPIDKLKDDGQSDSTKSESLISSKLPTASDDGLDKDVMEKIASSDEGLGKSLTEKANSLSKFGALDIMKTSPKSGNGDLQDYNDAEITTGPDPYSSTTDSNQPQPAFAQPDFSHNPMGENDQSQYLTPEGNPINSITSIQGGLESPDENPFGPIDDAAQLQPTDGAVIGATGGGYEESDDTNADTRSKTKDGSSYLSVAMGALDNNGVSGFNSRHTIPETLWETQKNLEPNDNQESSDSYSTSYNAQLFKRNIILRPEKDTYVSPFSGKESFENDA